MLEPGDETSYKRVGVALLYQNAYVDERRKYAEFKLV